MPKEKPKKWFTIFYRDIDICGPGKIKIHIPGLVAFTLILLLVFGSILILSGWSCGGCTKEPVKVRVRLHDKR